MKVELNVTFVISMMQNTPLTEDFGGFVFLVCIPSTMNVIVPKITRLIT